MKRRDFFKSSAIVGSALAATSVFGLPTASAAEAASVPGDQRAKAKLRFCSGLGIIPGANDEEKLKWMKANGFEVERYVPETMETILLGSKVESFKSKYDLVFYIGNIENASNKTANRINWHTLFGAGNNLPWFVCEVPAVFVSVGNPYHLLDAPMIKTYINGYCHAPAVIEAVVEKLMGRGSFKGTSPVDPFCGKWDTRL